MSEENEITVLKRYLHSHAYSQDMGTTYVSNNTGMKRENVEYYSALKRKEILKINKGRKSCHMLPHGGT